MESFSLLKYWRTSSPTSGPTSGPSTAGPTTPISPPTESPHQNSDDEGPFFDLHFTIPNENDFTLSLTSDESESQSAENLPISPSDDIFFKKTIFTSAETDHKPHITVFLLKSATRLRFLMLRLRKMKSFSPEIVADVPPLFCRESSCRDLEEKGFNSRVVKKYFSKIKPLYVRVSKRYSEKLRFSGGEWEGEEDETEDLKTGEKRDLSYRIYKHLRKKKTETLGFVSQRKDDSFLEQQIGIQSAIAHCKLSLKSSSNDSVF